MALSDLSLIFCGESDAAPCSDGDAPLCGDSDAETREESACAAECKEDKRRKIRTGASRNAAGVRMRFFLMANRYLSDANRYKHRFG